MMLEYGQDHTPEGMPNYSYEGSWYADEKHGLGAEESTDSYYYGCFNQGQRSHKGVHVMLDEDSRVTGCEAVEAGTLHSLLDALQIGIEYLKKESDADDSCVPLDKYDGGYCACESTVASENESFGLSLAEELQVMHAMDPQLLADGPQQGQEPAHSALPNTTRPASPNTTRPAISASHTHRHTPVEGELKPMPSPNHSSAWMSSPRLASPRKTSKDSLDEEASLEFSPRAAPDSTLGVVAPQTSKQQVPRREAVGSSLAWMAQSPRLEPVEASSNRTSGSAPASPHIRQVSDPASTGSGSVAFDLEIIEESAPAPFELPEPLVMQPVVDSDCMDFDLIETSASSQRHSQSSRLPRSPSGPLASIRANAVSDLQSGGQRPRPMPVCTEPSSPSTPSNLAKHLRIRASQTPDKNPKAKRPVLGPMLWSEDELAAFLYCMGINIKSARCIQRCHMKGVYQFMQTPNSELISRFGLASPVERLVIRKALKRFLDLDRWENAVRGRKLTNSTDDPSLREFVIPPQDLRVEDEISQGGFGLVYMGSLIPHTDRGGFKANQRYRVALKEMKGDRHVQLHELLKEGRIMAALKHKNICKFIGISAANISGPTL
jgi:hypothetical protein